MNQRASVHVWRKIVQLENFNHTIKIMERQNTCAHEASFALTALKLKIVNRAKFSFIPKEARESLKKVSEDDKVEIQNFIVDFYKTILEYITMWQTSFDGTSVFCWMDLDQYPKWEEIESSLDFASKKFGEAEFSKIISSDGLFDEFCLMEVFVKANLNEWKRGSVFIEDRWVQIFKHFQDCKTPLINMECLVEFALSLPGTSCDVERMFSRCNNMWTPDKSRMAIDTAAVFMFIKVNSLLNCSEFFDEVSKKKSVLEKILSSKKYTPFNAELAEIDEDCEL
jgi:hypothetical protein